jgi:DUF4097 and DUF4098 domain-containing protein YvlB
MRPMRFTRFVGLTGILAGCGLLLAAAPSRPQDAPLMPAMPTMPVMPVMPVVTPLPALPSMPEMPAVPEMPPMPALPAMPAMPAAPAMPAVPSLLSESTEPAYGSNHNDAATTCEDLHINFDGGPAVMETEERSVSKAEASTLRIDNLQNAGVQFRGWDKDNYSVTLCKFADRDRNDAKELLSQIKMSIDGGRISISGPGHEHNWAVHLLISTPQAANLDIQSKNGPVSFSDVDGKIFVRATNGPISMSNCTGEADLTSQNGPISISGKSGKLKLHTENGPISIALQSPDWSNGGLVADAVNGPVSLSVPSELKTSFVLESRGRSPLTCSASVCHDARKTWDDNDIRRIEFGSGTPVIRLSTVNGPLTVSAL